MELAKASRAGSGCRWLRKSVEIITDRREILKCSQLNYSGYIHLAKNPLGARYCWHCC